MGGLADATKSISQIFRTFQPTLQEIRSISNDLKASFEDEIGLKESFSKEKISNVEPRFASYGNIDAKLTMKTLDDSKKYFASDIGDYKNKSSMIRTKRKII